MNSVLNAKNGHIKLRSFEMDYIRFGNGGRTLVMIPGVGDGLRTVKGMAIPFSVLYRSLASDFTVYVFSRREELLPGMTTRDMANRITFMATNTRLFRRFVDLSIIPNNPGFPWRIICFVSKVKPLLSLGPEQ